MKIRKNILNISKMLIPESMRKLIPMNIRIWIGKLFDSDPIWTFDGWCMKTAQQLPWIGNTRSESFLRACQDVKQFEFSGDGASKLSAVDGLMWRHWIVSYCVRHAIEFTDEDSDMVECGVCDGITAFFALREVQGLGRRVVLHLYDAWAPMRKENLLESETLANNYSNISIQRVKNNLSEFDDVVYHPGYIPESFHKEPSSPEKISYLHIDLNSAVATVEALEHFWPRLIRGGVVLFDDYGWLDYSDTKERVDDFFSNKHGILMPLPTGQAIYYR
jgi:hypothetical protein